MTLAAQIACIVSAVFALPSFAVWIIRWYITFCDDGARRHKKALNAQRIESRRLERRHRSIERSVSKDLVRRDKARQELLEELIARSELVPLRLPLWSLILFEPEDAERWAEESESHLWELLRLRDVRQARRDRRKLIVRGLLFAVVLRATKQFTRAKRGN